MFLQKGSTFEANFYRQIMSFPKFLLGDNTDFPDSIFVIHTEFPRFIINLENDVFGMRCIPRPDFTENIEFARCNVSYGHVWNLAQSFEYKLGLMCFFQEYPNIGNK